MRLCGYGYIYPENLLLSGGLEQTACNDLPPLNSDTRAPVINKIMYFFTCILHAYAQASQNSANNYQCITRTKLHDMTK